MECIDHCASPTSTVRRPFALSIGPIVDPQLESLRISNSCVGTPAWCAMRLSRNVVGAFDVYRWLALVLMTTPPLMTGPWFSWYRDS